MNLVRKCRRSGGMTVLPAAFWCFVLVIVTGCASDSTTSPGEDITTVVAGQGMDVPAAIAVRPNSDGELWVTNRGSDSITIIRNASAEASVETRRDGYAEHFVARPSGISFDSTGIYFAVSNDSNNEVRGMEFTANPERNVNFKNNNFMGPALFASDTYALAGQNKSYLEDWPQPGLGHDPPDDIPEDDCPDQYWSNEVEQCLWPREGSHLDMLHGSPLSAGIAHLDKNQYMVLDGCGKSDNKGNCDGRGHVVFYDFNRDHQEGNGFHGDGVTRRYIDVPFTAVEGTSSGVLVRDGWVYYSDPGAGVVRRMKLDSGSTEMLVDSWAGAHQGAHGAQGPGITQWAQVPQDYGDGDDPEVIDRWIQHSGNTALIEAAGDSWIKPRETLSEYSYVRGATHEVAIESDRVRQPAGLAASDTSLFVADSASGVISEYSWDGLTHIRDIQTGANGLSGLAFSSVGGDALYFTDVSDNSVKRLTLT
jgi:DNA-binding beta-propeller fold protein YncE